MRSQSTPTRSTRSAQHDVVTGTATDDIEARVARADHVIVDTAERPSRPASRREDVGVAEATHAVVVERAA